MLRLTLIVLACALASAQQTPLRRPSEHADFGLPHPDATWSPYHQDTEHVCNRIWRAIYLRRCVPSEVAAALPREHGDEGEFFVPGWYFGKRQGLAQDARLFGGDGRQMPVEGFDGSQSRELRQWLDGVDDEVLTELRGRPSAAVWFQHDLLRLTRRLIDTGQNPELIVPLWRCARRVALAREVLQSEAVRTVPMTAIFAAIRAFDATRAVEVERRSSRLFDAEFAQLWSSVFVQFPARDRDEMSAWIAAGKQREAVPIGALAVLVQGIVAVDDEGQPRATDLIVEVRSQRLANRDALSADNPTATHDGVDFEVWSLPRTAVRDLDATAPAVPFAAMRAIAMQSQQLFRDYGTAKHTTYAAQCSLCHRRSNASDEPLAGFSALRIGSEPRPVTDAGERRRRAEREMARFVESLRQR